MATRDGGSQAQGSHHRDAGNGDGDVEREVVRVGIRGVGCTEDAKRGARSGRLQELYLTEEANVARQRGNGGLNGLAHVAQHEVGGGTSDNQGGDHFGTGQSHEARGIVADGVGGGGLEFIHARAGRQHRGGDRVIRGGQRHLLDEASNGRHFIIRA